ncbi:MAG TPA: hypothetical protein VNB64_07715 [Solirubrobacteraceae bacterium]|nr:hypothetical protein [Solirubrobacteraceae bacterium]
MAYRGDERTTHRSRTGLIAHILALVYDGNAARFGRLPEPLDPAPPEFL